MKPKSWEVIMGGVGIFIFAYLMGSIPFGLLLTKFAGLEDIRKIGSGNIGATNVLRTGKKWIALATLLLDIMKGTVAVLVALSSSPEMAEIAAVGAVIGHDYPLWLKFRGGKGVATTIGVILALNVTLGMLLIVTWVMIFLFSRISSLAAIGSALLAPFYAFFMVPLHTVILVALLSGLLIYRHRTNITRLMDGSEKTFRSKR